MSEIGYRQVQRQEQGQYFAPQLRQSLKVLQVPAMELKDLILEELQTNPLLEEMPSGGEMSLEGDLGVSVGSGDERGEESIVKMKEMEVSGESYGVSGEEANTYRQYLMDSVRSEESLQEHLMEQVRFCGCSEEERRGIEYLIGSLDDRGFLNESLEELASGAGVEKEVIERARRYLKGFDPVGIGSFDVRECLLEQLEQGGRGEGIAARILREEYGLLLRKRVVEIGKELGIEVEEVEEAIEEISLLEPAPGRRYREDTNREVTADMVVVKEGGEWKVVLNDRYIPRLRLNSLYKDMMGGGRVGGKDLEYIKDKIKSGKLLISALAMRQETLQRLGDRLVVLQGEFMERGVEGLKPLKMGEMARDLGVHETTVSRAVGGKYIETPHGIYELKYFFTAGYVNEEGGEVSNKVVKEAIGEIIGGEDKGKPYSDQKVVEILERERGIKIARRTVAKYREEMGILSTSLRRVYSKGMG